MKKYATWYTINPTFMAEPGKFQIRKTHTMVRIFDCHSLEDCFLLNQGEKWSPKGEARELIIALGLRHTSISVGDVVYDYEADEFHMVMGSGWELLSTNMKEQIEQAEVGESG